MYSSATTNRPSSGGATYSAPEGGLNKLISACCAIHISSLTGLQILSNGIDVFITATGKIHNQNFFGLQFSRDFQSVGDGMR